MYEDYITQHIELPNQCNDTSYRAETKQEVPKAPTVFAQRLETEWKKKKFEKATEKGLKQK